MSNRKKRNLNILQKLRYREIYGEIRECRTLPCQKLFQQLPQRLAFRLTQIAPASALQAGHVFLGFSKCGQFIISYTHSYDTDDHTLQMAHRYRLHWWLFVPYAQLRKVAEVMLFGDQDLQDSVCESVFISVCQWPKDLSKILIYGCSLDGEVTAGSQTRRVYITITAVPSLDNCSTCSQVARSYEEDDLAERWNSCVRFSCLQHGITVHTCFEMVPPFPKFIPEIQMKLDGCVVINAGNFIHVLSVNLENMSKKVKDFSVGESEFIRNLFPSKEYSLPISYEESEDDENNHLPVTKMSSTSASSNPRVCSGYASDNMSVMNTTCSTDDDFVSDKLRVSLRDNHCASDKDKEWEILIGTTTKPYVHKESRACTSKRNSSSNQRHFPTIFNDCDIKSVDSDCSSVSVEAQKNIIFSGYQRVINSPFLSMNDETLDSDDSTLCSQKFDEQSLLSDRCQFPQSNSGTRPIIHHLSETLNSERAEKEYEFIDEITEVNHEKLSVFRLRRLADKKYEFSESENAENFPQKYRSFRSQSRKLLMSPSRSPRFCPFSVPFSELSVELGETSGLFRSVYEKLLSPSGSASPNDVLRQINQNISSPVLSPMDDRWRDFDKLEKAELQRWSSRESLTLYSPVSHYQKFAADQNIQHVASVSPQILKCVVDIKRRYIEIDDELVSIITDIEDDELSSATGYHNALPLEVHGSGYTQMHMISNSKAEKLAVPGVFVRQVSLDVEQFCHETAQRLCNEAGKKYFFCHDYNVEIVDVCPYTGNVIALASVLVQAGINKLKPCPGKKSLRSNVGSHPMCGRRLYKATATFEFNVDSKTSVVLHKEPLVEYDPYRFKIDPKSDWEEREWWMSSRNEARELHSRWAIPTDYFSSVKVLTNEAVLRGKSLNHIVEPYHLVALIMNS